MHFYRLNSDYFVDKLKPEHADFIGEYWANNVNTDLDVINKYFKHIITTYDISAGMFTKSNPSYPVSWLIYSDIGHLIGLHTLPEYQSKNLALVACVNLITEMQEEGLVPVMEQHKHSPVAGKLGETYIIDTTWRDSITGEFYY